MESRETYLQRGYILEDACSSDVVSLYPYTSLHVQAQTPFANVVLATCPGYGKTLFLDNEIQSSEKDEAVYHECLVHPAMATATSRQSVLVIGGGEGATVREVLRWSDVETVTWIDIDGDLVDLCRKHLGWAEESMYTDPRVTYKAEDIRAFFKSSASSAYDVIFVDLPDPDTEENPCDETCLQNVTFWHELGRCLKPEGVFATHCGPVGPSQQRSDGLQWIRDASVMGVRDTLQDYDPAPYHVCIPSFQSDWGFLLSRQPRYPEAFAFQDALRFLTPRAMKYIFMWA